MIEVYLLGGEGYVLRLWKLWAAIDVTVPLRPVVSWEWADDEFQYFMFGLFSDDLPEKIVIWDAEQWWLELRVWIGR